MHDPPRIGQLDPQWIRVYVSCVCIECMHACMHACNNDLQSCVQKLDYMFEQIKSSTLAPNPNPCWWICMKLSFGYKYACMH